jgi:hypothetical protein
LILTATILRSSIKARRVARTLSEWVPYASGLRVGLLILSFPVFIR